MTDVEIAKVDEGQRHRHDLGDIKSLAESMTEVGLLHPIVVTTDMRLIAGGRRLAAARSLGWVEIPANVVSNISEADTILQAEQDENTCRKDFTPTEAASIKQAREALLKPMASERMKAGRPLSKLDEGARSDRTAARGTGFSATTLRKVEQVQAVAADESKPEPVREVAREALAEMDRTGKVDAPARQVSEAERAQAAVVEFPELSYYVDAGTPDKAIRLATTLRGLVEPERSSRRENLRKRIAADERGQAQAPSTEPPEPDYGVLAEQMFDAVNAAARVINTSGGAATVGRAAQHEDPIVVANWRDQFDDMSRTCAQLVTALKVNLRSVK